MPVSEPEPEAVPVAEHRVESPASHAITPQPQEPAVSSLLSLEDLKRQITQDSEPEPEPANAQTSVQPQGSGTKDPGPSRLDRLMQDMIPQQEKKSEKKPEKKDNEMDPELNDIFGDM